MSTYQDRARSVLGKLYDTALLIERQPDKPWEQERKAIDQALSELASIVEEEIEKTKLAPTYRLQGNANTHTTYHEGYDDGAEAQLTAVRDQLSNRRKSDD